MRALRSMVVLLVGLAVGSTGCLDFGNDEETTAPTKAQVDRCRAEMYLNPAMKIVPLGFQLEGSGIDDVIWFKFRTDVSDWKEVFDPKTVDVSGFNNDFTHRRAPNGLKWWDVKGKRLTGGQVELPNVRFMHVGIEKDGAEYVVYIMWHEV